MPLHTGVFSICRQVEAALADVAVVYPGHGEPGGLDIIATAILQRVESGQLALDATLADLLPEALTMRIANASMIDVRMLLSHAPGSPTVSLTD